MAVLYYGVESITIRYKKGEGVSVLSFSIVKFNVHKLYRKDKGVSYNDNKKSGLLYYSYFILNPLVCCAERTKIMPGKHLQKVKIKAPIIKFRNISIIKQKYSFPDGLVQQIPIFRSHICTFFSRRPVSL
jgi:hypothetical protein